MYSAVIFDLDNTLYDTNKQVRAARKNAVNAMIRSGLKADENELMEELERIVEKRGPNYQKHYNELISSLGLEENPKIIASAQIAYHESKKAYLVPFPKTIPVLLGLQKRNMKLGIISNGVAVKQWEKLIRLGIDDYFDKVIVCEKPEEGKPNPKPYEQMCEYLQIEPEDMIFVGDKPHTDILGANRAGMTSVQLGDRKPTTDDPQEIADIKISDIWGLLDIIEGYG